MTIAVRFGWVLTVANIGDCEAILDTGYSITDATKSHRLEDNKSEIKRMTKNNYRVTRLNAGLNGPVDSDNKDTGHGPLRCWPGGLANSRAIGDIDAGAQVIPHPHIKQVEKYFF